MSKRFPFRAFCIGAFFLLCHQARAIENQPPLLRLDANKFAQWSGLASVSETAATLAQGEAVWTHPNGTRGYYKHGFRVLHDGAAEWHSFYGLQMEVRLPDSRAAEIVAKVFTPDAVEQSAAITARVRVEAGKAGEWQRITLPWTIFDKPAAHTAWLLYVKELHLSAKLESGTGGAVQIRNLLVVAAPAVALDAPIRGRAVASGSVAEYVVNVANSTDAVEAVQLSFARAGWESFESAVEPATLALAPGETKAVTVRVKIPAALPPGARERQTLQAVANGDAASEAKLELITAVAVPHPFILHDAKGWSDVREKVKQFAWAKTAQEVFVNQAEQWQVPQIAQPPDNDPDDTMGPFLFPTQVEQEVMACGISWQLTGNKAHAEKVAEFLRRLSDPVNGYAKTMRACNQALVQEGHFFQHIAMSYDMVLDADVLRAKDREQIDTTFRMFMETIRRVNLKGAINNWNLSELSGALYCALAIGDLAEAERIFSGPSGVKDQLAKGTMDDGWWYECSISYNVWCASEFSQIALAVHPWGFNFKDEWLPANLSPNVSLSTDLSGGLKVSVGPEQPANRPFGMSADIWGPHTKSTRKITDLWDSLLPFVDYRGVMFGVNDSTENQVGAARREIGGQPFELAYSLFRNPAYASILMRSGTTRDLIYGVPELPKDAPEPFRDSAYADNVGLAMLRSQAPNRSIREQIQAVLHYGTHGWAHGHYDRTNLLSLMRYGRSFYNPEMIWYGYEPFMYKFYTQTSTASNMIVVDRKMQEATPGQRLLFHSGKLMQATAVETTARWSNPPYGGMVYDYVPVKTFAEKTWREGRYVPIPENPPAYGTLTDYTEPVLQRRLMIVTDDYVVLADYVKGSRPHTFESLLQLKGFLGLDGPGKKFLRHDAQWDADPLKNAQFITDADWQSVQAPAVARFEMRFGPGADNAGTRALYSEDGVLKLDVHSLWPQQQEIMVATAPEDHEVEKRLFYNVSGDGKILADGKFGAWILGRGDIDVAVDGVKELMLETKTELAKKPTLFWANARIVTRDGREIPLSQLPIVMENVAENPKPNRDYFDGPVKIVGEIQNAVIAAEPKDENLPARVRVDLSGADAVRFKAIIGGDYPLGNEDQRRKTFAISAPGKSQEARFLSIIEPHESASVVKSAKATDANHLVVELADGRTQEIAIEGMDGGGKDIRVKIAVKKGLEPVREETAAGQ